MAECEIEKYDKLPARVGWIDVDYLRWKLYRCNNPSFISKIPIIGWILTPNLNERIKDKIINKLDEAVSKCQ